MSQFKILSVDFATDTYYSGPYQNTKVWARELATGKKVYIELSGHVQVESLSRHILEQLETAFANLLEREKQEQARIQIERQKRLEDELRVAALEKERTLGAERERLEKTSKESQAKSFIGQIIGEKS